jgi:hypothetical protein
MRKLGYVSLSSLVFSLVVFWLQSSHVGAVAPVLNDEKKTTSTGSDAFATGAAEGVLVEPGITDQSSADGIGEDRVLGIGVRLDRPGDPSARDSDMSAIDGQSGPWEDVVISSVFLPLRRESI